MKIDPAKSALVNLLALIDASNPSAPNLPSEVTAGTPVAGSYPNGGDTKVTLTGTGPQGSYANFQGSVDVTYKRLTLAAEAANPAGPVSILVGTSQSAALAAVVQYFGFVPSEITAPSFTPLGSAGSQTVTLQASGSLIYEDGTTDVTINWTTPKTALLMHFDGDLSTQGTAAGTVSAFGSAAVSTAQSKFGNSSLTMGATTASYLTIPDHADLRITGSEDATIEFWCYTNSVSATQIPFAKDTTTAPYAHVTFASSKFQMYADTSAFILTGTISFAANTWNHIAYVRSGGLWTLYVNGVNIASTSTSYTFGNNSAPFYIGNWANKNAPWQGYIDEFRVSTVARYTANFTPPTAPFVLD